MEARRIEIKGVVQGVGFRPFVYRLAKKNKIKGWVLNNARGVSIHAEGESDALRMFIEELMARPPGQASIMEQRIERGDVKGFGDFRIVESEDDGEREVLIPPDAAMCPKCRREVLEEGNRRFGYAFTNCTGCGPRFTIIKGVPYDRPKTTMANFPMCPECDREYHDPLNRRFHAQPNACPECGPQLKIHDGCGRAVSGVSAPELLAGGNILAVKSLGGYHLVCDALNPVAVKRLRSGKKREAKPFAVMAKDIKTARKYCRISPEEEKILKSAQAPIVILPRIQENLPLDLAPGVKTLGVMLPYTPLHLLLFKEGMELLVMTSGNISSNPLVYRDEDAFSELRDIADYFLVHNREIYNRCDDSVVRVINNKAQIFRRARGYVPLPVEIPRQPSVLACGGDLKGTFCLTKGGRAFLSQHMGDLDNCKNFNEYVQTAQRMKEYLDIHPEAVVVDLHPGYSSRRWGLEQGMPVIQVQHHHAHLASCLADNGLCEKALGVICDGTGMGTDGHIWGMEFLLGDFAAFERLAHLEYVPMPGGERAVSEPLRMAASYLHKHFGKDYLLKASHLFFGLSRKELEVIIGQIEAGINTPLTSSCGRLFDAVSALLGVCTRVLYEGQAAIELEEIADADFNGAGYPFDLEASGGVLIISTKKMWRECIADISKGIPAGQISARFHRTVAEMIAATCRALKDRLPSKKVALSGGAMQNKLLVENVAGLLEMESFTPLVHSRVPANDGGLSLGQAVIGGRLANVRSGSGQNS
ncbi:MAG: carbamoyltransferase HypF [Tepidanaerobacteraceae bacterium]|jgi:hydrogenase maturation protein HypF|nr:carbamoyltransferase HypF [Tepidanaerobacteraceae bacterium]